MPGELRLRQISISQVSSWITSTLQQSSTLAVNTSNPGALLREQTHRDLFKTRPLITLLRLADQTTDLD